MPSNATGPLLQPYLLGDLQLSNRMVMAPMTRTRASQDRIPTPMMATYYAQRVTAGLIISECVAVSADSAGIIRVNRREILTPYRRPTLTPLC